MKTPTAITCTVLTPLLFQLMIWVLASPSASAFSASSWPSKAWHNTALSIMAANKHEHTSNNENDCPEESSNHRRSFLTTTATAAAALLVAFPQQQQLAYAAIDPAALKALPVEGDATGAATRLKQLEATKGTQPGDLEDIPFTKLESGVSYREYRSGKGDAGTLR